MQIEFDGQILDVIEFEENGYRGLKTKFNGEVFGVKAINWGDAASQIYALNEDGSWESTRYQVADFRHSIEGALICELETFLKYSD